MDNLKNWKKLIIREHSSLKKSLSELEISALEDWSDDCHEGFEKIFGDYLEKISESNYEKTHDAIVDIYNELQHIKMHIQDAENGFIELMNSIESKIKK